MYDLHNIDPYNYTNDPRAEDYRSYNQKINNVEDMKSLLLTNNRDDPTVGLATRYDLDTFHPYPFGLTDCKIVSPQP
jgi:hypothetical protein